MGKVVKHTVGSSNDTTDSQMSDSGGAPHADRPSVCSGVLTRHGFLEQLHREKRRADRSRAPLSLVTMRFARDGTYDVDDLRDIISELSLKTREVDIIGYLSDGVIAFLLPHCDATGAETFSTLLLRRTDVPNVSMDVATYPDSRFDSLLDEPLSTSSPLPSSKSHESHRHRFALAAKRGIDICGALALLSVLSPLMILVSLAIKTSSPGPVIFRQTRIGRGGRPFEFYKFRSMRIGGDDRVHREYVAKLIAGRHAEINEGDADRPLYKLQSDARITPIGRIIRKTSIDELPQLFNVLKGEMSLVGPRPPIPYEAESYQSWHMRRLQEVRPGLTGLWQVEGRSKTSFDEMVRLDLRYIRNWSLWLDIKILLRTIVVVLRCDGAD